MMGEVMEVRSAAAYSSAYMIRWKAEELAELQYPHRPGRRLLSVPPEMTAVLLMDKAGVPHDLIARLSYIQPDTLQRRLRVARALMMFPPYAARIEALMGKMPRYDAADVPAIAPAKEARCVAQAG